MNPVTRRLLDRIADPGLADWALAWDRFEEHLVAIHRAGACSPEDERLFERLRRDGLSLHRRWAPYLEPHWRATAVDGVALAADPFEAILAVEGPARVIANRPLLKLLPAAREALNGLLLERGVD